MAVTEIVCFGVGHNFKLDSNVFEDHLLSMAPINLGVLQ